MVTQGGNNQVFIAGGNDATILPNSISGLPVNLASQYRQDTSLLQGDKSQILGFPRS
jgi:hypothetical protein